MVVYRVDISPRGINPSLPKKPKGFGTQHTNPNETRYNLQNSQVSFTGCPVRQMPGCFNTPLIRRVASGLTEQGKRWTREGSGWWQKGLNAAEKAIERWRLRPNARVLIPGLIPDAKEVVSNFNARVPEVLGGIRLKTYLRECQKNFNLTLRGLKSIGTQKYTVYFKQLNSEKLNERTAWTLILKKAKPLHQALGELQSSMSDFETRLLPKFNRRKLEQSEQYFNFSQDPKDFFEAIQNGIKSNKALGEVRIKGILGMGAQCIAFVTDNNRVIKFSKRQIAPIAEEFLKGIDFPLEQVGKAGDDLHFVIQPLGREWKPAKTENIAEEFKALYKKLEGKLSEFNKTNKESNGPNYKIVFDFAPEDIGSKRNVSSYLDKDGNHRTYFLDSDCIGIKGKNPDGSDDRFRTGFNWMQGLKDILGDWGLI